MKILFVDIEINTEDSSFLRTSIEDRLQLLKTILVQIRRDLSSTQYIDTRSSQEIRAILTAPEYFFAKDPRQGSRHYSKKESDFIQEGLAFLSSQYKGVLLIPGTVAWKQPAFKYPKIPSGFKSFVKNFIEHLDDKVARGVRINVKTALDQFILELENPAHLHQEAHEELSLALLSTPRPFHYHGGMKGNPAPNDPRIKKQIIAFARKDLSLCRNTAFFYLNGTQRYEYHKRGDYNEVPYDYLNNIHIPGLKNPPIIEIGGLVFGIEICLDHNSGWLKRFIQKSSCVNPIYKADQIDIHLILSAHVEHDRDKVQKHKKGYVIHSSSVEESRRPRPLDYRTQLVREGPFNLSIYLQQLVIQNPSLFEFCPSKITWPQSMSFFSPLPKPSTDRKFKEKEHKYREVVTSDPRKSFERSRMHQPEPSDFRDEFLRFRDPPRLRENPDDENVKPGYFYRG